MSEAESVRFTYRHVISAPGQPTKSAAAVAIVERPSLSSVDRAEDAGEQVQAVFDHVRELNTIAVYVDGVAVGMVHRDDYPDTSTADTSADTAHSRNDNDGQSLLGRSRRYVAFAYRCAHCDRAVYCTAAEPPACPTCKRTTEVT
ncbi:hypothetical protein [Nocardia sp. NPDC059195]|uniref:hypothetical protein n=1 Tax=Nocardia sp. NPDC059195 TaxID=3346765 RepID=UPI0036C23534